MTDTVRCSVDPSQANHVVNCQVELGPEPSASPSAQASPSPAAQPLAAQAPAVTALVDRFPPQSHVVHAADVDTVTAGSVTRCLGQLSAVGVLLLGVKGPALAALGGFKVGLDVSACLVKDAGARQSSADLDAAIQECEDNSGIPSGQIGHTLICEVQRTVSP